MVEQVNIVLYQLIYCSRPQPMRRWRCESEIPRTPQLLYSTWRSYFPLFAASFCWLEIFCPTEKPPLSLCTSVSIFILDIIIHSPSVSFIFCHRSRSDYFKNFSRYGERDAIKSTPNLSVRAESAVRLGYYLPTYLGTCGVRKFFPSL